MKQRALSTTLVVMLALWGVGLPRFAHVMTAHLPQKATHVAATSETRSASRCTSGCCALHAAATVAQEPQKTEQHAESDGCPAGCNHALHCNICDLLATLLTTVPALPAPSLAWEPAAEFIAEAPSALALTSGFDPHAPRGPPARA